MIEKKSDDDCADAEPASARPPDRAATAAASSAGMRAGKGMGASWD